MRVGIGYDAHRFSQGPDGEAAVTLGGVAIPHSRALIGHSDADVLVHAVMDAILGASGGPDIGVLFPNSDPSLSGISSLLLLARTRAYIEQKGYSVVQVDSTVIAEAPRVSPHRQEMAQKIALVLGIEPDCVSVKATTNEKMGFIGRAEGIAAMAVATIEQSGEARSR